MAAELCLGGAAIDYDRERGKATCPGCGYEFDTVVGAPVFPPHEVGDDGTVTFRPEWIEVRWTEDPDG